MIWATSSAVYDQVLKSCKDGVAKVKIESQLYLKNMAAVLPNKDTVNAARCYEF